MDGTQLQNDPAKEREYARYLDEIEVRKQRVAVARADLQTMKVELERFETAYHARTGMLLVELARTELATDENERRLWWRQTHPDTSAAEIDADLEATFAPRHQQLGYDEETVHFHEQRFAELQDIPELDPGEQDELRRHYCDLVMRFFPDLARTEWERTQWAPIMERADMAYRDRDLAGLRALEDHPPYVDPAFDTRPIDERIVWAIREMARVFDLRMELGRALTDLRMSETFKLWNQSRTEPNTIDQLVQQIGEALEIARSSSDALREIDRDKEHD